MAKTRSLACHHAEAILRRLRGGRGPERPPRTCLGVRVWFPLGVRRSSPHSKWKPHPRLLRLSHGDPPRSGVPAALLIALVLSGRRWPCTAGPPRLAMNLVPPILVAVVGLALLLLGRLRHRQVPLLAGITLLIFAGGFFLPAFLAAWLTLGALAALALTLIVVALSGYWSRHLAMP